MTLFLSLIGRSAKKGLAIIKLNVHVSEEGDESQNKTKQNVSQTHLAYGKEFYLSLFELSVVKVFYHQWDANK